MLHHAAHARVAIEEPLSGSHRVGKAFVSAWVPVNRAAIVKKRLTAVLAQARRAGVLSGVRLRSKRVRQEEWAEFWKRFFKPSKIAERLYVVPSWEKDFRVPRGHDAIVIDPGQAFGTGQHATTALTLKLLLPRIRLRHRVLDVGCGSGILALAAARRGAVVYASDNDPLAVSATRANFRKNRLKARAILRASGVPRAVPRVAIIAANLSAEVLIDLAPAFAAKLRRGGMLISSGITRRSRLHVQHALAMAGFELEEERRSGEWLAQVHVK